MKSPAAAPIAVLPFGDVSAVELDRAAQIVDAHFFAAVSCLDPIPMPPAAFAAARRQFDADALLDELFARLPERCLRVVGVTEHDLFITGRTFVFGYAHLTDGVAIYSLARLRERFHGRAGDVAREHGRVERALVHELGHTFGAPHCDEPGCVMSVVGQLDSLDALSPDYCEGCHARVRAGLRIAPWSAEGRWQRGMALFRRREYGRAVDELESAVRCAPLDVRIRQGLELAKLAAAGGAGAIARSTA